MKIIKNYSRIICICIFLAALPVCTHAQEAAPAPAADKKPAEPQAPDQKTQKMRLDLRDAEIKTVVNLLAKLSNLIVIMGDDVKGKVTISSPKDVTIEEAYEIVMAVLDTKGISLIKTDRFLKVIQKREALQKPIDTYYGLAPESVPNEDRVITHIIPLKNAGASDILSSIRPLISPTGNAFENKNTNAIIITDVATNIRRLLTVIGHMDIIRTEAVGDESTIVYSIRYMKSKDIADPLSKVFADKKTGKADIKITPVDSANALIVTAGKDMHPHIKATLDSLDVRRRQVLIEAKIVEATLTKGLDFGIHGDTTFKSIVEGHTINQTAKMGSAIADAFLAYTAKTAKVNLALEALARKDKISILSSPRILTSDNQKSKITVADEQPILKSVTDLGSTQAGAAGKTVSDFVYKDVGIELEVTPRINVDRDVAMDIFFKISSILSEVEFPGGIKAPRIGKRESTTSVTVMDGDTLVIGGLMKDSARDERQKVPLLGDIPLLGWLFSKVHKVNERTELLVFITPHVVENREEGGKLTSSEINKAGEDLKDIRDQMVKRLLTESNNAFKFGDWDTVIKMTSEVLRLAQTNDVAYANRCGAYANKGALKEALEDGNMAVRLNPESGLAYNNRGYAYERLDRRKEALSDYEMSCSLGFDNGCANQKKLSGQK